MVRPLGKPKELEGIQRIREKYEDVDSEEDQENVSEAVHFCLLAEFDIDAGATLTHQYPYPTGTDEHRLAELMLPDGAHLRAEDWTVFYLGQTESSAVAPMLSHEAHPSPPGNPSQGQGDGSRRASMIPPSQRPKRGAAGGGLLYVLNCVRMKEDKNMRRGAMVKALAICTPNPYIGIYRPLLVLALEDYFREPSAEVLTRLYDSANAISLSGMPNLTRNERLLLRASERKDLFEERFGISEEIISDPEVYSETGHTDETGRITRMGSGSSVGHGQGNQLGHGYGQNTRQGSTGSSRGFLTTPPSREGRLTPEVYERRKGVPRDTHFFETEAKFRRITVPIRVPTAVFDEDVGEYSLIELVQTFSSNIPFPPPFHPHLHTNGSNTHPVILILNAILAGKRIMFLGHGLPANQVARMVLSACALGSGCGQVLRGITETAFPYANLASLDVLEEFSGYIVGVTNPRFEELHMTWDVLCNIETGRVTVSKNLNGNLNGIGNNLGASVKSGRSSETSLTGSMVKVEEIGLVDTPQAKMQSTSKADCVDNQFMEDVLSAMTSHFGETHIRLKFIDYLERFVRLAGHQEYLHTGMTKIAYPSTSYREGQLGSGVVFPDDSQRQREMWANGHRIDAWRKTNSYRLYEKDWQRSLERRAIQGFDVQHQISKLRYAKKMSDAEADDIFLTFAQTVRTYDQVVELLTYLPLHLGGLIPIANGLFHRWAEVRDYTVELLITMQRYPIGRQAVASMNYFYRQTYIRLLSQREALTSSQDPFYDQQSNGDQDGYFAPDVTSPNTVIG
ncbi:hypothetical protein TREMEDRAFT_45583 [Tremella mesenterica DSM 1558]|uniref:uncharacterized protein n=1 Tax=Tremella mesenterica (strain ATCC 24925 / CBS 8224 / DSM 1558 / NBRC 9311 / NRRL Y-6157 / RJB 2259-6 / UBC 559-6) TaxID=578456 RepID=UPI00032BA53B|nr:uncharacterized protein TREMEDRAFT_45583 [Tremella mesenterica DSM 1558]EIW66750.1 hypothetical protein TREMEDRAFT_45583 [Tremella mesenterica DSM 1558]